MLTHPKDTQSCRRAAADALRGTNFTENGKGELNKYVRILLAISEDQYGSTSQGHWLSRAFLASMACPSSRLDLTHHTPLSAERQKSTPLHLQDDDRDRFLM